MPLILAACQPQPEPAIVATGAWIQLAIDWRRNRWRYSQKSPRCLIVQVACRQSWTTWTTRN